MAKFGTETVSQWRAMAQSWLAENLAGTTVEMVSTGRDAWAIAHRAGITQAAYQDRDTVDAHIQTALQAIFPNAVFRDQKRY